jgi:hypothetical protein
VSVRWKSKSIHRQVNPSSVTAPLYKVLNSTRGDRIFCAYYIIVPIDGNKVTFYLLWAAKPLPLR